MELNAEQIADIAAKAATEAIGKLKPEKKDIHIEVVEDEVDKLLKDPKGGFRDMGQFFTDLIRCEGSDGVTSPTLKSYAGALKKTAGYMEEGDLSQGGYAVPEEFRATLLQTSLETAIVKPRATSIPMATNRVVIPALVDDDHTSNYFGGVIIYETAEGASKTATNPTFQRVALTLHKLTGYCVVTDELLQDSAISIEPIIRATFGQAIAFVQDYNFLRGSGVNGALGVFNSSNPSLVTVSKETNQVADTILWDNIKKMRARLYPAGYAKAIWVANIDTFPELAGMSMPIGTAGVPVWLPAGGAAGLPYDTLMGRPLIFTEKMATIGDLYDIGLVDFSQYLIGEKGGVNFASSIHVRFITDETAFRFVMRYDGQPWWLAALTPKAGSTLSPFVTLESR